MERLRKLFNYELVLTIPVRTPSSERSIYDNVSYHFK